MLVSDDLLPPAASGGMQAQFSKRTLRCSSSWRIEWLSAYGVTPSRDCPKAQLIGDSDARGQISKVTAIGHS